MTSDDEDSKNVRGRPFSKGESGNPNGRPKGSRNRRTSELQELIFAEADKVVEKLVEQALSGDQFALRLYFERALPKNLEPPINFEMPEIKSAADAERATQSVMEAVVSGELTSGQADKIKSLIEFRLQTIEAKDWERRLQAIEKCVRN